MKFYSLVALGAVAVSAKQTDEDLAEIQAKHDLNLHRIEGVSHFYDGYYKSFYKTNKASEHESECLNEPTIENMLALASMIQNPLQMFELKNIKQDMNLFGEMAEVAGDLSNCHFESSFFDLWGMCKNEPEQCEMSAFTQNLTKNMFVLMGKLTSMAETFKDFPAEDEGEYKEQMREIGSDAGTFIRVLFNYESPDHKKDIENKMSHRSDH